MELNLNLEYLPEDERKPFCEYIIEQIKTLIGQSREQSRYKAMEEYLYSNKLIDWVQNNNQYISVYDLYRLAANNLKIKEIDKENYEISINPNENIPNSYTILYSIISLLEYGTLSIRKCGTFTETLEFIAKNLDTYYQKFLMEANK